jgi:GTP cyclohydrolase IA
VEPDPESRHNHWDLHCEERQTLVDKGHQVARPVVGARCWECRPHQPGGLAPPRHADEDQDDLVSPEPVKILGVSPPMSASSVDGWEAFLESRGTVDVSRLERVGRDLLEAIGEDPDREGLRDTPARWARMWAEFVDYNPGTIGTVFDGVTANQLVVVRRVTVWSLCEHHLVPFKTTLTMGYLTDNKVMGLSKLARIAHKYAHRLQLQERLVTQIGKAIAETAGTSNVGVIGTGSHLCMEMRGVRTAGEMVTSHLDGRFLERDLRAEFLALHHG